MIVAFASLDVIIDANLIHLAFFSINNALLSLCRAVLVGCVLKWHNKGDNPHQSLIFISLLRAF